MKILVVGNFEYGWDGSICDEEHIASALEELGHTVYRMQRDGGDRYASADFTLIAQWDGYTDELISTLPKPIVYWAFDYQADGQEWHTKLVKQSDLYLSKRLADAKYDNWQWLSQDFAPSFLNKYPEKVLQDIDVLFTGTYLDWATERNETLKAVDDNFNLIIHSINPEAWTAAGFKNVHGPIMDDGLPLLYARAKINLSIDHTLEAGYWSDRNAQIMACGGFVLFRYVPLSEAIFRSNIAYFYNKDDCLDSIAYWLDAEEDREMIAAQALEWAPAYKVKERVADMLNIVRNIL